GDTEKQEAEEEVPAEAHRCFRDGWVWLRRAIATTLVQGVASPSVSSRDRGRCVHACGTIGQAAQAGLHNVARTYASPLGPAARNALGLTPHSRRNWRLKKNWSP